MPTLETHNGYALWHYVPSLSAAIVFTIIFAVATAAHTWKMTKTRMWFCLPFVIGGFFEIIGYAGRAASTNSTGDLITYIIQTLFILLAPILFAASLYMTLGRLVRSIQADSYSIISPRWLTKIFVTGDVVSFLAQGGGGGIMAGGNPDKVKLGQKIVLGGLILQVVLFAVFIVTGIHFNLRFRRRGGATADKWAHVPWQQTLNMLYGTSGLVLLRNVFRVIEYAGGNDGYLLSTEWPIYVFDAVPMFLTMSFFFFRYPTEIKAQLLRGDNMIELGSTNADPVAQSSAARRKPSPTDDESA